MISKRRLIVGAAATVFVAGTASAPYVFRAGGLYWAKSSARRAMAHFDHLERKNLNSIPAKFDLTPVDPGAQPVETLEFADSFVAVPRATSHVETTPMHVRLAYPGFQVLVLRPISTTASDSLAPQLQCKSTFEELSAAHHLRLDDLDRQPDLASLRRFLLLISQKPAMSTCREEFRCGDTCGFVESPDYDKRRTVVEVFVPARQMGFGVWFEDKDGLTDDGIHQFLRTVRFGARAQPGADVPSTEASQP
jgi:hypothetical protein